MPIRSVVWHGLTIGIWASMVVLFVLFFLGYQVGESNQAIAFIEIIGSITALAVALTAFIKAIKKL